MTSQDDTKYDMNFSTLGHASDVKTIILSLKDSTILASAPLGHYTYAQVRPRLLELASKNIVQQVASLDIDMQTNSNH